MTKLQIANTAMLSAVQKVMVNNQKAWENVKPISDEMEELEPLLKVIADHAAAQFQSQTGGYTNQKDAAFELMNSLGYKMSQKLSSWARKNGDEVALKAVYFAKSVLESGTETEQISRNVSIVKVGADNLAATAVYKVTADNIAALQTAIDQAKSLIVTRDTMGSSGIVATQGIGTTIKKAVAIVAILDPMIESMLEDEDKFVVDLYEAARKVEYHRGGVAKAVAPMSPTV